MEFELSKSFENLSKDNRKSALFVEFRRFDRFSKNFRKTIRKDNLKGDFSLAKCQPLNANQKGAASEHGRMSEATPFCAFGTVVNNVTISL